MSKMLKLAFFCLFSVFIITSTGKTTNDEVEQTEHGKSCRCQSCMRAFLTANS